MHGISHPPRELQPRPSDIPDKPPNAADTLEVFACTKCGVAKPGDGFSWLKSGRRAGKRRSACKACCNQLAHDQRVTDPERIRKQVRDRRAANREHYRQQNANWRFANRELARQQSANWRAANLERIKKQRRALYAANPERARQYSRDWGAANREQKAERHRLRKFKTMGYIQGEYAFRYDLNQGKCEICKEFFNVLSIDHNHDTNRLRDLLCVNCNAGLGQFKDSPERLRSAAAYLLRFQFAARP